MPENSTVPRPSRRPTAIRTAAATITAMIGLSMVPALATTAYADGPDCDQGAFCVWEDADFQGRKFTGTGDGQAWFTGGASWLNDVVSSAKNNTGKWVGVYEDIGPQKIISCFPPNTQLANFRDSKLGDANDKASAYVIGNSEQDACGIATQATRKINCDEAKQDPGVSASVGSGFAPGSSGNASNLALSALSMLQDAYRTKAQRGATVQKLVEGASRAQPGLNIMVYDVKHDPDDRDPNKPRWIDSLTGVHEVGDVLYCNQWDGTIHTYRIWAFEGGEFTNQSDGGWINWGFYGRFTRMNPDGSANSESGSRVRFYPQANGTPRSINGISPDFGTAGGGTGTSGGSTGGTSGASNRPAHGQVAALTAANGLAVDLAQGSTTPGTRVQAYGKNNSDAQKWAFWDKGNGNWLIETNFRGGMVIDRDVNSNRTGLWKTAEGATNQLWQFADAGNGWAQIRNSRDGNCLTADTAGQALAVQSCDGSDHQKFRLG
ncbi:RICIN domain-containing protein [Streptomyces sp. BPTC-684]|uniref:RICIN domain-containing protein n=1 Tax=Streptomyces sp. BPTC-684 TaxID=3043734 RepID=UPI0024B23B31|nr:RICIN domain-containing protein [Streptomyces sp. BPTC-684]WHM37891.1 RICIN domain-containing protein [Streptomyces sp. BPTC-684]